MSREKKDDGPVEDKFTVLFTSLSVILLAFFILLNSMSISDQQRKRIAFGSLIGGFGILPGGLNFDREGNILLPGTPMLDKEGVEISAIAHLKRYIARNALTRDVKIIEADSTYRIEFKAKVLFVSGGTLINPRFFRVLDEIGSLIKRLNSLVRIEGHADRFGTSRNWKLSLKRAIAAKDYLVDAAGVPKRLLLAIGRAHYRPETIGNNAKDQAVNRRIEIVVDRAVWQ
ncbi:MAG: OmpA family protein [Deltaproteobacteria bacterium]|nr:OmpA family protein [Deltaproteobacteria bacterium]